MHELSIALSMIEMATDEAQKRGAEKVEALYMKLGALSGVVKDALLFSWEIACQGTPLEGSRLEIEEIPVVVFCENCRADKMLDSINNFVCPVCNTSVSEIISGKELQVTALEIV
jgi:hydrogenase nickel incorporation protein HypA/HybF